MRLLQRVKETVEIASNLRLLREELERRDAAFRRFKDLQDQVVADAEALFDQRQRAAKVIDLVETLVNQLANTPKEFDKTVTECRSQADEFQQAVKNHEVEAVRVTKIHTATGATVAGAGVAVAALGPSAAMAVATTFGVASTGAAITSLSGAAATSAALAWLGGGALAAGGGGVAAGTALLALAGPVGWALSVGAATGTVALTRRANRKKADQAAREREEIGDRTSTLQTAQRSIRGWEQQTRTHSAGILGDLAVLWKDPASDYSAFASTSKERLGAVINHTRALGKLIHERVNP